RYLLQYGRLRIKLIIKSSDKVINFIQKDTGEMFPKWEFDVENPLAENIIKLMFVKKPWNPAKKKVVKEDSPRPRKKARKEAPAEATAEASEEDIADAMREGFGTCLKEIKYLSERVEAVEKKVGITTKRKGTSSQNTTSPPKPTLEPGSESVNGTNAGRKSLAEDKAPEPSLVLLDKNQSTVSDLQKEDARYLEKKDAALALCRAKSDRTRKLAASQKSPYTANRTARVIISNRKLYPGYNPFAPIDKNKLRELAEWLKSCPYYRTALDKKPLFYVDDLSDDLLHIDAWINVLRKRYNANPQHFRSERILEPFTYERPTNIPPARADFAKANGKCMRDKMAVDIFQELPDAHEFVNKDMDDILGTYDG
ncbi:unnamed protein product, partial [Brassica oleracea var. botrytis]